MKITQLRDVTLDRAANRPAIWFEGRWYDWGWMSRVAGEVDRRLEEAGVGADDPIGFIPHNRPEFAAALLAILSSGRHLVMIYAYQSQESMARRIADLRLPVVIAGEGDWGPPTVAGCRDAGAFGLALAPDGSISVVGAPTVDRDRDHARAPEARGVAMLTSGTTGPPKHFEIDYERFMRSMISESTVTAVSTEPLPALHYFPFGNIAGLYTFLPSVIADAPIIMFEKFSLDGWLGYIRRYRPKRSGGPPAMFRMILESKVDIADLAGLECIGTGAASLDPSVRREFENTYGVPVLQSYGATEFGGVVSMMTLADRKAFGPEKADSVGRPWAGAQFRITDAATGVVLPAGEVGRLEVQAPRMGPGWISTTDLAMLDDDGFLYHRGRLDGAIMRGGFKIVPDVVSEAAASHPAIAAASVVGVANPKLGETPAVAFELRAGCQEPTRAELEAYLRGRLPATHIPTDYLRVDQLPRTPSLKVDTAAVRALFSK